MKEKKEAEEKKKNSREKLHLASIAEDTPTVTSHLTSRNQISK